MSVGETTGQAGSSGQANLKSEIGVVRAADANQVSIARVTDIGTHMDITLVSADDQPNFVGDRHVSVGPAARTASQKGIGVPYNPNDATTVD